VALSHVRREANVQADKLVNAILDNAMAKKDSSLAKAIAKEHAQKLHQPKLF
jgi:hypothetical protein